MASRTAIIPVAGRYRTWCLECPGVHLGGFTYAQAHADFLVHCESEHMGDIVPDNDVPLFGEADQ